MNGPIELLAEQDKMLLEEAVQSALNMEDTDLLYYKNPESEMKFFVKPITEEEWTEVVDGNINWDEFPDVKIQCELSLVEHSPEGLIFNNKFETVELDISAGVQGIDGEIGWTNNSEFGLFMQNDKFVLTEWPLSEAQDYFKNIELHQYDTFYNTANQIQTNFDSGKHRDITDAEVYDPQITTKKSNSRSYEIDEYQLTIETELTDPDVRPFCDIRDR